MNNTLVKRSVTSRVGNSDFSMMRQLMPEQPWWQNLESNFHKLPDDFELDAKTQVIVKGTAAIDVALRTAVASLVSVSALPLSASPMKLKRDMADSEIYSEKAKTGDPTLFFKKPPSNVVVHEGPAAWPHFRPENGSCIQLSFDSPFVPTNPRLREQYRKNANNMKAVAQYWRHDNGPRPTICVIHGFMADPYWLNSVFLGLPWFYKQGYDILLYTLPHHGQRKTAMAPFSGYGYFSGGIANINETVAHSVHDFRVFMDYLEGQGVEKMGVTGISLGGYTSSLLAAVDDRLYFSIPNVPVVSLFDLMLQWYPASWVIKAGMALGGVRVHEARNLMAVHCPLTYKPLIPKERLFIIGGAGDRLAPPKHARLLWEHWDECLIHWFPGNHVLHFDRGLYLREMRNFMKRIDFSW